MEGQMFLFVSKPILIYSEFRGEEKQLEFVIVKEVVHLSSADSVLAAAPQLSFLCPCNSVSHNPETVYKEDGSVTVARRF